MYIRVVFNNLESIPMHKASKILCDRIIFISYLHHHFPFFIPLIFVSFYSLSTFFPSFLPFFLFFTSPTIWKSFPIEIKWNHPPMGGGDTELYYTPLNKVSNDHCFRINYNIYLYILSCVNQEVECINTSPQITKRSIILIICKFKVYISKTMYIFIS